MDVYQRVADLLEYPDERLSERLDACVDDVMEGQRRGTNGNRAAESIARFRAEADALGIERLQELYTAAFDLDPDCALYAGHHLFGADARRGVFMASLAAEYRRSHADPGTELPDYLPAMLRYAARAGDGAPDVRDELVADVLLPVARTLADALERRNNPYRFVMQALVAALGPEPFDEAQGGHAAPLRAETI